MINTTKNTPGRFANHFFRNMVAHFITKKNLNEMEYSNINEFNNLGIKLFRPDNPKKYVNVYHLDDTNFFQHIINSDLKINANITLNNGFFQTKEFCFYLKNYFYNDEINKQNIIKNNKYNSRYNNNNDLFIHIRLGDIITINKNLDYDYYDKILSTISFQKGFISSDSIENEICKKLIKKYNLYIIKKDEVDTIMFGSTCKHIVLSNGTFSWLIGFLSFNFSNIYYPDPKIKGDWHGDIFVYPEWKKIM